MSKVTRYPRARPGRGTGAALGGAASAPGASVPLVRWWPFELQAGTGLCSVGVSQAFQGMAVITDAEVMMAHTNFSSAVRFDILVSDDDSGAREGVASFAKPNGISIFDNASYADPNDADTGTSQQLTAVGAQTFATVRRLKLRVPVIKSRFFLKTYAVSSGGAALTVQGQLRVVCGLAEEEIVNFL